MADESKSLDVSTRGDEAVGGDSKEIISNEFTNFRGLSSIIEFYRKVVPNEEDQVILIDLLRSKQYGLLKEYYAECVKKTQDAGVSYIKIHGVLTHIHLRTFDVNLVQPMSTLYSANLPNPGIKYTIRVKNNAVNGDRKYLSVTDNGKTVDLFNEDDGSGRQQWFVVVVPGTNIVNIQVYQGINNDRRFLSCTPDGKTVDLFKSDDGTGRQRWILELETLNTSGRAGYYISAADGTDSERKYLSTTIDGKKVDLWNERGDRQLWLFEPIQAE